MPVENPKDQSEVVECTLSVGCQATFHTFRCPALTETKSDEDPYDAAIRDFKKSGFKFGHEGDGDTGRNSI